MKELPVVLAAIIVGLGFIDVGFIDVASAQSPPGYVVEQGAFINGWAIGTVRRVDVSACAAACNAEPRCLSFEMNGADRCTLNSANRSTRANLLSRNPGYTYYEKATAQPTASGPLFIYQNCSGGPDQCILGVADGQYSTPSNARYREGWRRLVDEGPFSDHPAAWRRLCRLHAPPSRAAPDIAEGRVDCDALGVPSRASSTSNDTSMGSSMSTTTGPTGPSNGAPAGYVIVEGAFINGSAIGRSRPGQTPESCAALCSAEPRCLSFELYDGALCSLNAANRSTRPNILSRSPRYRYFERTTD